MIGRLFRNHPYEIQFWGYELGNVIAALSAITPALIFAGALDMHTLGPDLLVPIALAVLIGLVAVGSWALRQINCAAHAVHLNTCAACIGAALLAYAFFDGENWLSIAAVAFLTGSALIRLTDRHPVLLKVGALFLVLGGLCLGAFGLTSTAPMTVTAVLTGATGLYVAGAGLLTYAGGVFLERDATQAHDNSVGLNQMTHMVRKLDAPLMWGVRTLVEPAIFWVSAETKATQPFATSMWARLPFRLATALAAALTFTPQGTLFALANLLWALGDIAIGALDWARTDPFKVNGPPLEAS